MGTWNAAAETSDYNVRRLHPNKSDDDYTLVRPRSRRDKEEKTLQFLPLQKAPPPDVHVENRSTSRWSPPESRPVYEVLTRNCAYRLNCKLECVEVVDLWSGRAIANHPLLGAWLAGGRKRDDEGEEYSYPLPAPGSKAVFQLSDPNARMAMTSTVERAVLMNHRYRPPQQSDAPAREAQPDSQGNPVIPLRHVSRTTIHPAY